MTGQLPCCITNASDMPTKRQPPRSTGHSSHASLLALVASLGLVACILFAQPVRRAYVWIAAVEARLPIDVFQQAESKKLRADY